MRNILLFYTWIKRNALLQAQGMVERPGLYNALFANFERTREKYANEPEYFGKAGAIPTPFGNLTMGSPWADIHRWELTWDGFRKEVLGSVTPPVRVPIELMGNFKAFTGGRIKDYEGERTPSWMAAIAAMTGSNLGPLNVGPTTVKAGGESAMGMEAKTAYALSQITGPQGSWLQRAFSNPDHEGTDRTLLMALNALGIKPQQNKPESFARAAKYLAAKKKADETRRKGAQGG